MGVLWAMGTRWCELAGPSAPWGHPRPHRGPAPPSLAEGKSKCTLNSAAGSVGQGTLRDRSTRRAHTQPARPPPSPHRPVLLIPPLTGTAVTAPRLPDLAAEAVMPRARTRQPGGRWPCCHDGDRQSPWDRHPARHSPYHDAGEQADPLPAVGVRDHVAVANGEEGDGDEPHGSQEVAGYVLLVVVSAKETRASATDRARGRLQEARGHLGMAAALARGCAAQGGGGINNVAGCPIAAAVAQFLAQKNPRGQNLRKTQWKGLLLSVRPVTTSRSRRLRP